MFFGLVEYSYEVVGFKVAIQTAGNEVKQNRHCSFELDIVLTCSSCGRQTDKIVQSSIAVYLLTYNLR